MHAELRLTAALMTASLCGLALLAYFGYQSKSHLQTSTQYAAVSSAQERTVSTTPLLASAEVANDTAAAADPHKGAQNTYATTTNQVDAFTARRTDKPYTTDQVPFSTINAQARAATVNILCQPRAGGSFRPISGSGVIIDPRGVILTNAHVAQYVLLSETPVIDLSCIIRTDSPATPRWTASVLYIPTTWVAEHAAELNTEHPTGTGEHDYALLVVSGTVDGKALPSTFPSVPIDTRENIAFQGDSVLVASYPAEFAGGVAAQYGLYAASSITSIQKLITFRTGSIDIVSLGGIIEAQSGSSGGAVVNAWNYLVAMVSTTSPGPTTEQRDLRALTLAYINRDLADQSGETLEQILSGDLQTEAASFTGNQAPKLIAQYLSTLKH